MSRIITIKCPICGKEFTKDKYHAKINPNCRKCNINKTYKENPEKLEKALEKRKETCKKVYGVDNVAKNQDIKDKYISTQKEKYGGVGGFSFKNKNAQNAAHLKKANEKRQNTSIKNWGTTHHMKNKEFHDKFQKDIFEKYGTIGPTFRYMIDDMYFDSSWEVAYYIWLVDNHKQFIYHPNMPVTYVGDDNKEHKYYPDFLVEGQFIEIKGDQFFNELNEPYDWYKKKFWWEKYNMLKDNKIRIIRQKEAQFYVKYVNEHYGKSALRKCKIKK